MLEKDVHIGDIFRLGEAVIQITQGRVPCSTITKRTNNPFLLKRMVQTGFTGYLCRESATLDWTGGRLSD